VRHVRHGSPFLVLLLALALVAAACGGGGGKKNAAPAENVRKGGTLTLSAEQELDCAAFLATCGNSLWGTYVLGQHVLPLAYTIDPATGKQVPTNLLAGPATLETSPVQKVTYKINPAAKWSDGQPITATDFKFTWQTIVTRDDSYDKTGYKNIDSVDDSVPSTAVVTFKQGQPFGDWRQLFGAFFGLVPAHLLQGKDVTAEMTNGFTWSGGPWKLDHWAKGQELALVPNPNYWGQKPNLDKVVFKFITDTAAESQAFKTGQVALIQPQPQLEQTEIKALPNVTTLANDRFDFEAIWFNTQKPPVNSKAVRQALAYATDRQAIVTQLFGPIKPDSRPIQSFTTPANKVYYQQDFARYTRDLAKVDSTMKGDGWAKGPDGIWAKGGQKANLVISSTTGNKRRELTEQILQSQWKEAGFNLTVDNKKSGVLFGELLPAGSYQISLYAQTPSDGDPTNAGGCSNFCTENIPKQPALSGNNYTRISDPALDTVLKAVDNELDEAKRLSEFKKESAMLADDVPAIPLDALFQPVYYYNNRLGGVADNPVYASYSTLAKWFCKSPSC
jgi:peptide/nickel transport system substrate-binding protein